MKLSQAFGDTISLRIKPFELGGKTFKVRIPVAKEIADMEERIEKVDEDKFTVRYEKAIAGLDGEGVERVDGDVLFEGKSTKELIRTALQVENRITELFKLLVPVDGEISDLTYEDIEAELPFSVQIEMIRAIQSVIQPGYGEARKNS
jgi:hypothetical protein